MIFVNFPMVSSCLVVTLAMGLFQKETSEIPHSTLEKREASSNGCDLDDPKACGNGFCCIKEVISFQDLDIDPRASTLCHPHLTLGQLCLRQTEGYLCDCAQGLKCDFRNNETYGHCVISEKENNHF